MHAYPPEIEALLDSQRLPELGPGKPNRNAEPSLRALSAASFGRDVADQNMAQACLAGLWLLHDFLDESHAISQAIHTPTGCYWHAIMHRREGDFENAKYWFRRVGNHEVFPPLLNAAQQLAQGAKSSLTQALVRQPKWDPYWFVDQCESSPGGDDEQLLKKVARAEWDLLFDDCFQNALETGPKR